MAGTLPKGFTCSLYHAIWVWFLRSTSFRQYGMPFSSKAIQVLWAYGHLRIRPRRGLDLETQEAEAHIHRVEPLEQDTREVPMRPGSSSVSSSFLTVSSRVRGLSDPFRPCFPCETGAGEAWPHQRGRSGPSSSTSPAEVGAWRQGQRNLLAGQGLEARLQAAHLLQVVAPGQNTPWRCLETSSLGRPVLLSHISRSANKSSSIRWCLASCS